MNTGSKLILRAIAIVWCAVSAWEGLVLGQQPSPLPTTWSSVKQEIEQTVTHPRFAAGSWGVKVVSAKSGAAVFEHNARKLFSPASNCKLYTVALALDRLGPDYRIKTSVFASVKPDAEGRIAGDVIIYGRCDPSFNARLHGGDLLEALQPFAAVLTNAGIKRISGSLIGDTSFVTGPELGSGWTWDDQQYYYGAEISALTVSDNTLAARVTPGQNPGVPCVIRLDPEWAGMWVSNRTVTTSNGSPRSVSFYRVPSRNLVYVTGRMPADDRGYTEDVPVHRPAALFLERLVQCLRRNGIAIDGKIEVKDWLDRQVEPFEPQTLAELGNVESPPLKELVREIQKPSQNLYTDLLLAHIGEVMRGQTGGNERTSEELGIRELNRFLNEIGIPRNQYYFEEGSGLSRNNLASPSATVALLRYMAAHKTADVYIKALPIAGVDGTLRNRMKGTVAAGNVRAKTGSLRWANSLSGYVTTAAGEPLVFCLMLNRYQSTGSTSSARAELDRMATLLAGLAEPTQPGQPTNEPNPEKIRQ